MNTQAVERHLIQKAQNYKDEINKLSDFVLKWEREIRLGDINKEAKKCYEMANELLMDMERIKDADKKKTMTLSFYSLAKRFLENVESVFDRDICNLLFSKLEFFSLLYNHLKEYCIRVDSQYNS